MLRARLRLLLFAVALNLAVCAADYGERSKNHEEYKEKLADWEADGGWNHDKYQRWQNGTLMFSKSEVDLAIMVTAFFGLIVACWVTMPDGSGEHGKYM